MRTSWRHLLALLLLPAAVFVASLPGPARAVGEGGDEPETPHKHALPWRDDPEQYRRLKEEWKAFRKLPAEKQDRVRLLDEQLNEEPPAVRARLWAVLDRYNAWLKGLDEKDRQRVDAAPDTDKKLDVIRGLREREWVSHLARAERERIEQAAPEERPKLVEAVRQKERKKRADWQTALRQQGEAPPPQMQANLWPRVRQYEEKALVPTLSEKERNELAKAALSSWPEHALKLTELSQRHPILLPPSEQVGVVKFADPVLPPNYALQLFGKQPRPKEGEGRRLHELRELQGRWPNFALELDKVAKARKAALPDKPLGPCEPGAFIKDVQDFINKELRTDAAAAKKLDEAQGKWPDYPQAVMQLAKEKKQRVPGTFLPGPREFWERAKAPQVD
jgi:hypothetical protein